jgi:hypothetical protein
MNARYPDVWAPATWSGQPADRQQRARCRRASRAPHDAGYPPAKWGTNAGYPPAKWGTKRQNAQAPPLLAHWWTTHGVPSEPDYGCLMPTSSMDERERGIFEVCGCTNGIQQLRDLDMKP